MVVLGVLPLVRVSVPPRQRRNAAKAKPSHKASGLSDISTEDCGSHGRSDSQCSSNGIYRESSSASVGSSFDTTHGGRYVRGARVEKDYVVEQQILGSGMSGHVMLATRRIDGAKCAVKRFDKESLSMRDLADMRREVDIYLCLDHPHIARLERVYETETELSLVMEYLEGGDVFERIAEGPFSAALAADTLRQMLLAVEYLHRHDFVHCDLKPENFAYSDKRRTHVKLLDFGLSRRWEGDKLETISGTLHYIAPEVLKGAFTSKADMWALGVLAHHLLCGYTPFVADKEETMRLIRAGTPKYSRSKFLPLPAEIRNFVGSLLSLDEESRPNATQALEYTWLRSSQPSPAAADKDLLHGLRRFAARTPGARAAALSRARRGVCDEAAPRRWFLSGARGGAFTRQELQRSFASLAVRGEAEALFLAMDQDEDGEVSYSEFLAAASFCSS